MNTPAAAATTTAPETVVDQHEHLKDLPADERAAFIAMEEKFQKLLEKKPIILRTESVTLVYSPQPEEKPTWKKVASNVGIMGTCFLAGVGAVTLFRR